MWLGLKPSRTAKILYGKITSKEQPFSTFIVEAIQTIEWQTYNRVGLRQVVDSMFATMTTGFGGRGTSESGSGGGGGGGGDVGYGGGRTSSKATYNTTTTHVGRNIPSKGYGGGSSFYFLFLDSTNWPRNSTELLPLY